MAYSNRVFFEDLRSESTIGATYTALGAPYTNRIVQFTVKNNTNGDVILSDDTSSTAGKWFFPAGSYEVIDIRTNAPTDTDLTCPVNFQLYIKDGTTPSSSGTVYVSASSVRNYP